MKISKEKRHSEKQNQMKQEIHIRPQSILPSLCAGSPAGDTGLDIAFDNALDLVEPVSLPAIPEAATTDLLLKT